MHTQRTDLERQAMLEAVLKSRHRTYGAAWVFWWVFGGWLTLHLMMAQQFGACCLSFLATVIGQMVIWHYLMIPVRKLPEFLQ